MNKGKCREVGQVLAEEDEDIPGTLRSLLDTLFMLSNKLYTPTARTSLKLLDVLTRVFSVRQ